MSASDGQFYNPTDDALYNIFWNQLSGMSEIVSDNDAEGGVVEYVSSTTQSGGILKRNQQKKVIESYTCLSPGTPIEFIVNKKLTFGNFIRMNAKGGSIHVQSASGRELDIAVGQVISVWDILQDEEPIIDQSQWAQVAMDALDILGQMSPRKSDLEEFHHKVSMQRSSALPIDSLDLGIYIFQERSFKSWIDPYGSAQESNVHALSAAQRYASSVLLFHDDFHFKRRQSHLVNDDIISGLQDNSIDLDKFINNESIDESSDESSENVIYVVEGGYKVLDAGVVTHREGDVFAAFYAQRILDEQDNKVERTVVNTNESPFRKSSVTKQLRGIEVTIHTYMSFYPLTYLSI